MQNKPIRAALKYARQGVGQIERGDGYWYVWGSFYVRGKWVARVRTEETYREAQKLRARWVAYLALVFLGWDANLSDFHTWQGVGTSETIVKNALVRNSD